MVGPICISEFPHVFPNLTHQVHKHINHKRQSNIEFKRKRLNRVRWGKMNIIEIKCASSKLSIAKRIVISGLIVAITPPSDHGISFEESFPDFLQCIIVCNKM